MALSGKYISLSQVIDSLIRDRGYKYELPYSDVIEWSVEAIKLIGAPMALITKQEIIAFDQGRAKLPSDYSELIQIAGSFRGCYPFAMSESSSSFLPTRVSVDLQLTQDILAGANIDLSETTPIGQDINGNPVYAIQENNIIFPKSISDTTPLPFANYNTYSINDNYIFPTFESGYLFLAYRAIPVDCEGLPMIPEDQRYVEAIKSFIGWKIDCLLYRKGELNRNIYEDSYREWLWYVGSAGNFSRVPTIDGMQSLLNQVRILGNKYSHGRFFNNLSK